jgi:hypothetical protein
MAGFHNNFTDSPSSGAAKALIGRMSCPSIRSERASIDCPAFMFPGIWPGIWGRGDPHLCGAVGYRRDTSLQEWLDGILLGGQLSALQSP